MALGTAYDSEAEFRSNGLTNPFSSHKVVTVYPKDTRGAKVIGIKYALTEALAQCVCDDHAHWGSKTSLSTSSPEQWRLFLAYVLYGYRPTVVLCRPRL